MVSRIGKLLEELDEMAVPQGVRDITKEYLDTVFKNDSLPFPALRIVNHTVPKTLGTCKFNINYRGNTEISLEKAILDDDKTLRRVIAHELIHHWEFLTQDADQMFARRRMGLGFIDNHGSVFKKKAAEVNAVLGDDFVTVMSDTGYNVTPSTREFYVLIQPKSSFGTSQEYGEYSWASAIRPSEKQKRAIELRKKMFNAKLFKTSNQKLQTISIGLGSGSALTKDKEIQDVLKDMYNSGKEITL